MALRMWGAHNSKDFMGLKQMEEYERNLQIYPPNMPPNLQRVRQCLYTSWRTRFFSYMPYKLKMWNLRLEINNMRSSMNIARFN